MRCIKQTSRSSQQRKVPASSEGAASPHLRNPGHLRQDAQASGWPDAAGACVLCISTAFHHVHLLDSTWLQLATCCAMLCLAVLCCAVHAPAAGPQLGWSGCMLVQRSAEATGSHCQLCTGAARQDRLAFQGEAGGGEGASERPGDSRALQADSMRVCTQHAKGHSTGCDCALPVGSCCSR